MIYLKIKGFYLKITDAKNDLSNIYIDIERRFQERFCGEENTFIEFESMEKGNNSDNDIQLKNEPNLEQALRNSFEAVSNSLKKLTHDNSKKTMALYNTTLEKKLCGKAIKDMEQSIPIFEKRNPLKIFCDKITIGNSDSIQINALINITDFMVKISKAYNLDNSDDKYTSLLKMMNEIKKKLIQDQEVRNAGHMRGFIIY